MSAFDDRQHFHTHGLEAKVHRALQEIRKVFDHEKAQPVLASKAHHAYEDKFELAENVTALAVASWFGCLETLGLERGQLGPLVDAADAGQRLTLRLKSEETCEFLRKDSRDVPSDNKWETNSSVFGKRETRVVTTVHTHLWRVGQSFELFIFAGASEATAATRVTLARREAKVEVMTKQERPPLAERNSREAECDITWLLSHFGTAGATTELRVSIDRNDDACLTPRRNKTIDAALEASKEFYDWCNAAVALGEFCHRVETIDESEPSRPKGGGGLSSDPRTVGERCFVPVLPLFAAADEAPAGGNAEAKEGDASERVEAAADPAAAVATPVTAPVALAGPTAGRIDSAPPRALGAAALNKLLTYEAGQVSEALGALTAAHPPPSADKPRLLSALEARLCFAAAHAQAVLLRLAECVCLVEEMLRTQLVAAIGREVTPSDFQKYMVQHSKRLYQPMYAPQPFCFAVRMPGRSPEGVVSLEAATSDGGRSGAEPVHTIRRHTPSQRLWRAGEAPPAPPMSFALDAATRVTFHGERYLHCYLDFQFEGRTSAPLSLAVRARQFSSFMVLLGRLGPGGTFEPAHAVLVRNKDELTIPLELEQLPSAKEFKDAISSLSAEQQRFAKAYRQMQLEGAVFGVLVVQLKPQLERLLRLPPDSLTKEIELTQSLLDLFVQYQIPSDLLAYDGDDSALTADKLNAVRAHVAAIYTTLESAKKAEIAGEMARHAYAHPEAVMGGAGGDYDNEAPDSEDEARGSCNGFTQHHEQPMFGGSRGGTRAPRTAGGKGGGGSRLRCARNDCATMASAGVAEARFGGPGSIYKNSATPAMAMAAPPPPPMLQAAPVAASAFSACPTPYATPVAATSVYSIASYDSPSGAPPPPAPRPVDVPATADGDGALDGESYEAIEYTTLPAQLDARMEALDTDAAMRPTKISVGEQWTRRVQKALLAPPATETLYVDDQAREKQRGFDLLDALSNAGALPLEDTALHVILAATHAFDESLINTVVRQNINPIEKLERSSLILAETIQAVPAPRLIRPEAYERVAAYAAPALLPAQQDVEQEVALD